jgi:C_GCAxxG_C_C family probable redox protein
MEEFGIGSFDMIRALSPFPGLGATGRTCGAVTGGLLCLGLYFGKDNLMDYAANSRATRSARVFLDRFEETLGSLECRDIQELLLGRFFDPREGKDAGEAFARAGGFEKCTVIAGLGARIASELIIDDMERAQSAGQPATPR